MSTTTPLDIKIIGGGIAGLSAALALLAIPNTHSLPYKITILESAPSLSEFGAGIQLFANATRIIHVLGLEKEFSEVANKPRIMEVRRYADDRVIGEIQHNPESEWLYGYPHWQVYRPDFQRLLAEAVERKQAQGADVKILFNQRVQHVDHATGTITFQDGRTSPADLVIAADGLRGKIRETIPGNEGTKARPFQEQCFRAIIPKEKMDQHPETRELMRAGGLNMVWCGPGMAMLGYPVNAGNLYSIVLAVPRPAEEELLGKWSQPGDPAEGAELLKPFNERCRKLWSLVTECNKWTLGDLPPLKTFASESGRLCVIGDAAHAILPHSGQGGAQALEDSASLATLLSTLPSPTHLPQTLSTWNTLRQTRLKGIRRYASGNQQFLTMPDGPEQVKRDELWGAMTRAWKKELEELGEEGVKAKEKPRAEAESEDMRGPGTRMWVFGYDAFGEAERAVAAA
ncbi:hypothetical protein PRZ48_013655 [Zasmidium cellare]|uniref:FAD-binding domain-containing protein n=1 Tax=Zasmidium cellare TaxID=395010 RepID=A0ABR0E1M2_ZASCE|nr:hypothetical protein PRZ48_013655 [Zasmidium cellare]